MPLYEHSTKMRRQNSGNVVRIQPLDRTLTVFSQQNRMNVLSLFDGISCARVALGERVKAYYASEIDKRAIQIAKKNHPSTIHLGDVKQVKASSIPVKIDLLIGGSPCQDLSIANQNRKSLAGDRSKLFYEFVRIKKECNPTYFILENVASMSKEARDTISKELGVEPICIDAALVSAQRRRRLFWTNIPGVQQPADKGIVLKDILQENVDESYTVNSPLTESKGSSQVGHIGTSNSQANRVYSVNGKSVCLSANGGGLGAKTGLYCMGRNVGRRLDKDGKRVDDDTSIEYSRRIELRTDEKTSTLTSVQKDNLVVNTQTNVVRRLTPVECERLQSLPDNYTEGISQSARYKCLGNAFNVEVIRHILSYLPTPP